MLIGACLLVVKAFAQGVRHHFVKCVSLEVAVMPDADEFSFRSGILRRRVAPEGVASGGERTKLVPIDSVR
jgi:hypothetical protein